MQVALSRHDVYDKSECLSRSFIEQLTDTSNYLKTELLKVLTFSQRYRGTLTVLHAITNTPIVNTDKTCMSCRLRKIISQICICNCQQTTATDY